MALRLTRLPDDSVNPVSWKADEHYDIDWHSLKGQTKLILDYSFFDNHS